MADHQADQRAKAKTLADPHFLAYFAGFVVSAWEGSQAGAPLSKLLIGCVGLLCAGLMLSRASQLRQLEGLAPGKLWRLSRAALKIVAVFLLLAVVAVGGLAFYAYVASDKEHVALLASQMDAVWGPQMRDGPPLTEVLSKPGASCEQRKDLADAFLNPRIEAQERALNELQETRDETSRADFLFALAKTMTALAWEIHTAEQTRAEERLRDFSDACPYEAEAVRTKMSTIPDEIKARYHASRSQ
jgi:hypothetical protein